MNPIAYISIMWGALGLIFVSGLSQTFTNIYGALVLFVSFTWSLSNPKLIPALIPFAAVFGPFVKVNLSNLNFTLADFYIVSLCISLLVTNRINTMIIGSQSMSYLIYPAVFLVATSTIFSIDYISSFAALTQLAFIYICYILTLNLIEKDKIYLVLNSWIISILIASCLSLYFFSQGLYMLEVYDGLQNSRTVEDASYFFRLTYIFSGFHYLVGISLLSVILIFMKKTFFLRKIFLFFIFLFLFLIATLVNIKTTIFAAILVSIYFFFRILFYSNMKLFFNFIFILPLVAIALSSILFFTLGESQYEFIIERFSNFASLDARLNIYFNVLEFMSNEIATLITGIGPGITTRFSDAYILQQIYIGKSGYSEGAIDSSYFTFMLEYGVLFVLLIIFIVLEAIFKLRNYIIWNKPSEAMTLQAILIFSLLIATTQLVGLSKSAWIFPQILALAHIIINSEQHNTSKDES